MMRTVLAHVGYGLIILLGISMITFGLLVLAPGDPAEILLQIRHEVPQPEQTAAFRQELGFEKPLAFRYIDWLCKALTGDLGRSWQNGEPVVSELIARLPATIELALSAFLIILVLSTVLGTIAAIGRNRITDSFCRILSILAMSVPGYWLGFLLIYCFAIHQGFLPVMGRGSLQHIILPAITLGLGTAAMHGRVLRATLIDVLGRDHVRFAIAKGLNFGTIMRRHVIKNALGSVMTLWAISLGHLLGGSAIVESVFSWPGLGRLAAEAVLARDIPMIQGTVLVASVFVVTANIIGDTVHKWLNPYLQHGAR